LRIATDSAEQTRACAAEVAALASAGDIFVLAGELGTGKTVWVQGFARGLGVVDQVTSPTFTLVRPYTGKTLQLLHADVYRLDRLSEVVDLGLIEQLDEGMASRSGGSVACIEWGDLAEPALPADFVEVRLEYGAGDDDRTIELRPVGGRWSARFGGIVRALTPWIAEPGSSR
jgi:tRNA threonylcarbamoyladenosine biosynthesis protein TsaE